MRLGFNEPQYFAQKGLAAYRKLEASGFHGVLKFSCQDTTLKRSISNLVHKRDVHWHNSEHLAYVE